MKQELDAALAANVVKEMAADAAQRKVRAKADEALALSFLAGMGVKIGDRIVGNRARPFVVTKVEAKSFRVGDAIQLAIIYYGCQIKADGTVSGREVELHGHRAPSGAELPHCIHVAQAQD